MKKISYCLTYYLLAIIMILKYILEVNMGVKDIRQPIQKRSIEKKAKIIEAGFNLICKKGYYNTNTAEIAKEAGVSTGIVYQYFKDKHDILIEGIKKYSSDIFYPMLNIDVKENIDKDKLADLLRKMINKYIENHKLSQAAHEEITAMIHSDEEIAHFFKEHELFMTNTISNILINNGCNTTNLKEKVHIGMHLIDDLCHEIVYHKHQEMNYDIMINLVIDTIINLLK